MYSRDSLTVKNRPPSVSWGLEHDARRATETRRVTCGAGPSRRRSGRPVDPTRRRRPGRDTPPGRRVCGDTNWAGGGRRVRSAGRDRGRRVRRRRRRRRRCSTRQTTETSVRPAATRDAKRTVSRETVDAPPTRHRARFPIYRPSLTPESSYGGTDPAALVSA